MDIRILHASMTHSKEEGYVGSVHFEVQGHQQAYEVVLYRKKGKEWSYGLHFLSDCGIEEEITALEEEIEENDELFDQLTQAAMDTLQKGNE